MGGWASSDSEDVHCLDLETCTWRTSRQLQLSIPRSEAAAVAIEGFVYLVGGNSYGQELALLERTDGEAWEACERPGKRRIMTCHLLCPQS